MTQIEMIVVLVIGVLLWLAETVCSKKYELLEKKTEKTEQERKKMSLYQIIRGTSILAIFILAVFTGVNFI